MNREEQDDLEATCYSSPSTKDQECEHEWITENLSGHPKEPPEIVTYCTKCGEEDCDGEKI